MTKKVYIKIAYILQQLPKSQINGIPVVVYQDVVCDIAKFFEDDNSQFDRKRFFKACGLEDTE